MRKTAGQKIAEDFAFALRFGKAPYQARINSHARRIDAAIRRAVLAERKACRKFVDFTHAGPPFDEAAKARDAKARER